MIHADLAVICDACTEPIPDRHGYLWVSNDATTLAVRHHNQRRLSTVGSPDPLEAFIPGGEFIFGSTQVPWQAHHGDCDTEQELSSYTIPVTEIRTWSALLNRTAQLMEKNWLPYTDWDDVLRLIVGGTRRIVVTTPANSPCPACSAESTYLPQLDRYVHADGSDNRACWLAASRSQLAAVRTNPKED